MADIYNHWPVKMADAGLQLRVPVDLVPANQYSRLTNATPIIEGRLEARAALKWIVNVANPTTPGSGLHSLARLNQSAVSSVGDRVAGIDTTVQTFALPSGSVATSRDTTRSGDPLSLANFHYANDSDAWQILSDYTGMKKYKSGLYQTLGGFPTSYAGTVTPCTGTDGGAGNLNSTGGPGYDWVATYVNTRTLTETNPTLVNYSTIGSSVPSAFTSPDPGFGGAAGTTLSAVTAVLDSNSATESRQSVLFKTYAAGTPPFTLCQLLIQCQVTVAGTSGCSFFVLYLSLDGGTTWKLIYQTNQSADFLSFAPLIVQLPASQDLTLVQVRACAVSVGNTTTPQNVIARRIRNIGGNLSLGSLLTGGGGNRTIHVALQGFNIMYVTAGIAATTVALVNRLANVCVPAPVDTQYDAIRLYRRGGSVTASWAFVGQFTVASLVIGGCGAGTLQIVDNIADANLGGFVSLTNDPPVNSVYVQARPLPYVWGPGFNPARLFGCGDPDRPDSVYYSNPGNADQWGVGQWVDVSSPSDPMQNGCVFNTRVFAFSKERMFELVPMVLGGTTLTPFQTPCSRGLISPWGLLSTARMIYFVAKDGIYSTTGGEETSLVENDIKPLFPTLDQPLGRSVEGYDPVDMERIEDIRLRLHNDELYFIYRGISEGQLNVLVYDQNKKRWRAAKYPVNIATAYSEEAGPASSLLFGDSTGSMYSTQIGTGDVLQASTPDISVTIRTGAYDQGLPLNLKEYGNVLFDIDPGGATVGSPVTITPLLNGEVITAAAITVTGTGRQQVPLSLSDVFGFNIEFQITFVRNSAINPVLYQFDILWRSEPASVKHWEARETSHGLIGWQHLRDMNIPIRSTGAVTLTLTFDGTTTQTYTLASTASLRQKVYVPMHANKFKLVRYSLDSAAEFRVYESDLEVRAKPWVTQLGYAIVKPFGGESSQAPEVLASELLGGK